MLASSQADTGDRGRGRGTFVHKLKILYYSYYSSSYYYYYYYYYCCRLPMPASLPRLVALSLSPARRYAAVERATSLALTPAPAPAAPDPALAPAPAAAATAAGSEPPLIASGCHEDVSTKSSATVISSAINVNTAALPIV